MKFTILDTVSRVSKAGKPYTQAACKGMSKNGTPWLFIATIPAEALPGLEYSVALWVKADDGRNGKNRGTSDRTWSEAHGSENTGVGTGFASAGDIHS